MIGEVARMWLSELCDKKCGRLQPKKSTEGTHETNVGEVSTSLCSLKANVFVFQTWTDCRKERKR